MIDQQGIAYQQYRQQPVSDAVLRAERVALLFRQGPVLVFGTLLAGAIQVAVLWQQVAPGTLLGWMAVLYLWTLLRVAFVARYHRRAPAPAKAMRWAWGTAGFSTVFGLIWGCGALLFLDPAHPTSMILIPVVIMGLNAGAAMSLVAFPQAYVGFAINSNGLLLLALVQRPGEMTLTLVTLVLVSTAVYLANVRVLHRMLAQSIRLRFENQLLRRETIRKSGLLETTLSNIDQGIGLLDRQGWLRMWNRRLLALTGVGDPVPERRNLADLTDGLEPLGAASRGSLWQRADGTFLELQRKPTDRGEVVLTCTDVTPLHRRERALEAAIERAEAADRAKARFLAAASHDLRQPIQAMGLLQSLLEARSGDGSMSHVVEQMGRAVATADELLGDLLDISRLEAGVETPELGAIALDDVFDELWEEFRPVARERNDYLRLRPTTLVIHSDRRMLMRILRNLLANALKFTRNGRVLVAVRRRGSEASIAVWDTGPGIAPHQQESIFEAFQQLHNPERDRRHGLGLGLAIVRHTANLLDLAVEVHSRVGSGSCFALRVPLAKGTQASTPATLQPAAPPAPQQRPSVGVKERDPLAGRRIWLIDDDPIVIAAMEGLLRQWGCRVVAAEDYEQALLMADDSGAAPDALLVDYRLPSGRTGLETVLALRERLGVDVPGMLITGDTAPERLREASDSGLPLYHKPVSADELRRALSALLSGATAGNGDEERVG